MSPLELSCRATNAPLDEVGAILFGVAPLGTRT